MRNLLSDLLYTPVHSKDELIASLKEAATKQIIEADMVPVIEAVLHLDDLRARDIMLPRHQVDILDVNDDLTAIINKIARTGHSRFPVIDGEISNIIGVFHSKDLIRYFALKDDFNLREHIRQAYFVPEIKRLDGLLYEMRVRQTHLAIVVDEFTNVVGIITLEMIVEQIIGEIEDEHDSVEGEREIVELGPNSYRVKGYCSLNQLNAVLDLAWQDDQVETVGGFLIKFLGRIPVVGEILDFENLSIEVINSDSRKIKLLNFIKK